MTIRNSNCRRDCSLIYVSFSVPWRRYEKTKHISIRILKSRTSLNPFHAFVGLVHRFFSHEIGLIWQGCEIRFESGAGGKFKNRTRERARLVIGIESIEEVLSLNLQSRKLH
jgi:hypothetical protein